MNTSSKSKIEKNISKFGSEFNRSHRCSTLCKVLAHSFLCLSFSAFWNYKAAEEPADWNGQFDHQWFGENNDGVGTNWTPLDSDFIPSDRGLSEDGFPTAQTENVTIIGDDLDGGGKSPTEVNIVGGREAFGGKIFTLSGGSTVNLGDPNNLSDQNALTSVVENIGLTQGPDGFDPNSFINQYESTTHTVSSTLTFGGFGHYQLFGGNLNALNIINNDTFIQNGGAISGIGPGGTTFTNNLFFNYTAGTFNGSLINNGTANFSPTAQTTFGATISGSGNFNKTGAGTLILSNQNNSNTGSWTVSGGILQGNSNSLKGNIDNNATVVFDQASTGIYANNMTGRGNLIKQNNGLLILNGNNTAGNITVNDGNLQIGDDTHLGASLNSPVTTIDPTGILSGHGTVNGNVVNNGTLSPGGSIGTLNVNGNVDFNLGSTFNVEINPNRASRLNVNGAATLGNANVSVLANRGAYSPRTYTILTADSILGRFSGVSITNPRVSPSLALLTPSLQFSPTRVNLSLDTTPDPGGVLRKEIDRFVKGTLRTVGGRLNTPLGENCPENRFGFWARGIGMVSNADASGSAPQYDSGTAGTIVGFDKHFSERLTLGIAGFYAHSDATTYQRFTNNSSADSLGISLYSALTDGAWQFKGVVGYDNDNYNMQRTVAVTATPTLARSKTHANHVNGYAEASYSFKSGDFTLQPLVGLQLGWMRQKGYRESSGANNEQVLSVSGRTLYTLDTIAGLRARQEVRFSKDLKAQFEVRALYDHDFGTLDDSVTGRFNNGPVGLLGTADRPNQRDAGILGASFSLLSTEALNFYLDYNGEIRSGQQSHFFSAGVRYSW